MLVNPVFAKDADTKELVVYTLSQEWPLSARKIHQSVKPYKTIGANAIFKTLGDLIRRGIITRKDRLYSLNPEALRDYSEFWNQTRRAYSGTGNLREGAALSTVVHEGRYVFLDGEIRIDRIPSAAISKSTLAELVETTPTDDLRGLSRRIAAKDYEHIRASLTNPRDTRDTELMIKKLDELARLFYWGRAQYTVKEERVELKILTDTYTTPKGKRFYVDIYIEFMRLLGYRLTGEDELSSILYFIRGRG